MAKSLNRSMILLLATLLVTCPAKATCPRGDLTDDCRLDLLDLEVLAEQWLTSDGSAADLNGDGDVGLHDLAVLAASWRHAGIPVSLNEVMASNSSNVILDPQGQSDDWIEIHNQGSVPIDIGGMYLTDDVDRTTKWRLPTGQRMVTTIPAGGFQVIWADADVGESGLHANFKLDANGDEVYLFDTDGLTLIDAVEFGRQSPNISWGRYPNGNGEWRFMGFATPGAPNIELYQGFVAVPEFSHDRGFYEDPFDLTITCDTPGAIVYYTVDGSEPYQTGGRFPTGRPYTGPIHISRPVSLRAKAVKPGWMESATITHTYLFLDQVIRQSSQPAGWPSSWGGTGADYAMDPEIVNAHAGTLKNDLKSLPTMSLVMKLDDLFSSSGIYANWNSQGVSWERPGSIEMFYPDGTDGFQSNCGVRIYGGVGRREKKKSFRLLFKGVYGATKLNYPLFGEDAVDQFDTIILRANFNDGYPFGKQATQCIRDEYCRRLQLALGHPSPHGTFVHLYVNGLYWGLYNPVERPDASFAASYFGGEKEDYDAYNSGSPTGESRSQSWSGLLSASRDNVNTTEGYQKLQGNHPDGTPNPDYVDYLDVAPYVDFMIANFFVGNTDWPGHNWYGAMNRLDSTGFKFFMWDAEWVLWITVGHGLDSDLHENRTGVSNSMCEPYARLRSNAQFRQLFGDRVHRAFFNDGPLYVDPGNPQWNPAHPERNQPAALYAELADLIEDAMRAESARWGDVHGGSPRTIQHWRTERDRILGTYMTQRAGITLSQIRSAGLYPNVSAPVFLVNGQPHYGGPVPTNERLAMSALTGRIVYTTDGTDPRQPVSVNVTGDTIVRESAGKRVLVPTGPVAEAWKGAGAFDDSSWTFVTGQPGGVGYDSNPQYRPYFSLDVGDQMSRRNTSCYIRIPFTLSSRDMIGWNFMALRMRFDDGFVAYINGVKVANANAPASPRWNSSSVGQNSDTAAVNLQEFDISDALSALRSGSNVLAIHGLNTSSTSSDFLISCEVFAGKKETAGDGLSSGAIEYAGPLVLTESTQVKACVLDRGTWSALNEAVFAVGPVAESLRISELMYHPAETGDRNDPNTEYVELTNIGGQTINLNRVSFTDGIDFTFPSFELPPGDYCLVVGDVAAFAAAYGAGFNVAGQYAGSLNNAGERIALEDAAGRAIHDFDFRDGWYDLTDGMGFSLTVQDPVTADPTALGDKGLWRPSAFAGGSPGFDDSADVPPWGAVVINELLANATADTSDWIELHNTSDHRIDVGGWFLSDDADDLTRYEIAEGTTIAAGGYLVLYADRHFDNADDPGAHVPFALSRNGETLYLHSGSGGVLGGYSEQEKFDASDPGVSLGRYQKSTGAYNFVALSEPTPGTANADPQVGPIVINEIMYHPDSTDDAEYVELLNIDSTDVTLYDALRDIPWRFTDDPDNPGIELLLPSDPPVVLAPGERLVLVKDRTLFDARFTAPADARVLAWGQGNLANGSEKIQVSRPGDTDADGTRLWIRVDRVVYSDGTRHADFPGDRDPWPLAPDGQGFALHRIEPSDYGNDPVNWQAGLPSPGR